MECFILRNENIYGLMEDARTGKRQVVIIKSLARSRCVNEDGMTDEQFEEHWDYNIAGSKGVGQYSVVDDEVTDEQYHELFLEENDIEPIFYIKPKETKS